MTPDDTISVEGGTRALTQAGLIEERSDPHEGCCFLSFSCSLLFARGPWLLAPGSWPLAPGPWPLSPGPWPLAPGSWLLLFLFLFLSLCVSLSLSLSLFLSLSLPVKGCVDLPVSNACMHDCLLSDLPRALDHTTNAFALAQACHEKDSHLTW